MHYGLRRVELSVTYAAPPEVATGATGHPKNLIWSVSL